MTLRDLGDHLRSMGNLSESLKYYIKTRDHCSTSEHVVEMCLNVIEVSLELKEYHSISAYVSKAEGLLDSYNPLAASSSSSKSTTLGRAGSGVPPSKGGSTSGADAIGALFRAGGSSQSASLSSATAQLNATTTAAGREAEAQGKRQIAEIRSKLNVAQGIAHLGMSKYNLAKISFLEVDLGTNEAFSNVRAGVCECGLSRNSAD
jgi:COP9 signalosome complex subunit 1